MNIYFQFHLIWLVEFMFYSGIYFNISARSNWFHSATSLVRFHLKSCTFFQLFVSLCIDPSVFFGNICKDDYHCKLILNWNFKQIGSLSYMLPKINYWCRKKNNEYIKEKSNTLKKKKERLENWNANKALNMIKS